MTEVVSFDLDGDEGSVLVELDPEPGLERLSRNGADFAKAKISFQHALVNVREAATAALRQFQAMDSPPDEVEIQFGVKLNAEAGAIIARTSAEGHLDVTIKWQRNGDRPKPPESSR